MATQPAQQEKTTHDNKNILLNSNTYSNSSKITTTTTKNSSNAVAPMCMREKLTKTKITYNFIFAEYDRKKNTEKERTTAGNGTRETNAIFPFA